LLLEISQMSIVDCWWIVVCGNFRIHFGIFLGGEEDAETRLAARQAISA
jgi:hypothetical protein